MQLLGRRLAWGALSVKKNGRFWLILAPFLSDSGGVFGAFFGEKSQFWLNFLVRFLGIIEANSKLFWLVLLEVVFEFTRVRLKKPKKWLKIA